MVKKYGKKKGAQVFHASINKGTIKGAHKGKKKPHSKKKTRMKKKKGKK
jgi:hypothetical protein